LDTLCSSLLVLLERQDAYRSLLLDGQNLPESEQECSECAQRKEQNAKNVRPGGTKRARAKPVGVPMMGDESSPVALTHDEKGPLGRVDARWLPPSYQTGESNQIADPGYQS
jgi:hypothetical protein